MASLNGHLDVVAFLLRKVRARGIEYLVAGANDEGVDNGANVNTKNDIALRWASRNGHLDIVEFLQSKI